ncbi:MAG: TRAP transporter fused permease subunit [Rhizobiaceae bacterium]|nr:TRAP transporter fused permease subunit [Rhizobiaceae bacterium]
MESAVSFSRLAHPRVLIGAGFILFQIWILFEPQQPLLERPVHLIFALVLLFLWRPLTTEALPRHTRKAIDAAILTAVLAVGAYYLIAFDRLSTRMENVSPVLWQDVAAGTVLVLLLLEGARRAVGWILVAVLLVFIIYAFFGPFVPGWLRFRGFDISDAIEISTMTTAGVLGVTTSTSVHFVFYFVAFGAVYSAIGGGQLFIDVALRLAGWATGGAAKAAIIASSLMGTISGSAVANVTATGVFTIPLMRRSGFHATRAAGVEAIASTGGQLMPPIMGVAAFVMAELLSIPYARIALAGLIPAAAFYFALLLVVDLSARRLGLKTLSLEEVAAMEPIWPRIHLLVPPMVLIGCLMAGYSASYSAVLATGSCLLAPFLRRRTWIGPGRFVAAVEDAPRQAAEVAVPIAAIGLIIAVAVQSNLALKFANSLLSLSDGSIFFSLGLAILGCIIMGMGLPTVAAYIIGAVLYVPALKQLGIDSLAAHFFIFYYCVLSMVTPPVALASFAAAGVAGTSAMRTSFTAFAMSLVAFFIPFGFVFDDAILFSGTAGEIALASAALIASTALWGIAVGGWCGRPLGLGARLATGGLGLVAVIAPFGSAAWIVSSALGWGLVVGLVVTARASPGALARLVFADPEREAAR